MSLRAIEQLNQIVKRSQTVLQYMHDTSNAPEDKKHLKLFSTKQTADLVGREPVTIQRVENELLGTIPRDQNNRRIGYNLEQILSLKSHFGTLPGRVSGIDNETMISALINFKGGVSKTTTCINYAHYLALQGYKVLLVDMDSQATLTSMMGVIPDFTFQADDTVLRYLNGDAQDLNYAIRKSHWQNIDYIPACLGLYGAELGAATLLAQMDTLNEKLDFFRSLQYGLETVSDEYDIILIDAPPSLGIISMLVLLAANNLIVPCPARMYDFASTVQFFKMVSEHIASLDKDKSYNFIRVLVSQYDKREPSQEDFLSIMRTNFNDVLINTPFFNSTEITKCSEVFETPYEQSKANKRIIENMNAVFSQIELEYMKQWPSKKRQLEASGYVA